MVKIAELEPRYPTLKPTEDEIQAAQTSLFVSAVSTDERFNAAMADPVNARVQTGERQSMVRTSNDPVLETLTEDPRQAYGNVDKRKEVREDDDIG